MTPISWPCDCQLEVNSTPALGANNPEIILLKIRIRVVRRVLRLDNRFSAVESRWSRTTMRCNTMVNTVTLEVYARPIGNYIYCRVLNFVPFLCSHPHPL